MQNIAIGLDSQKWMLAACASCLDHTAERSCVLSITVAVPSEGLMGAWVSREALSLVSWSSMSLVHQHYVSLSLFAMGLQSWQGKARDRQKRISHRYYCMASRVHDECADRKGCCPHEIPGLHHSFRNVVHTSSIQAGLFLYSCSSDVLPAAYLHQIGCIPGSFAATDTHAERSEAAHSRCHDFVTLLIAHSRASHTAKQVLRSE